MERTVEMEPEKGRGPIHIETMDVDKSIKQAMKYLDDYFINDLPTRAPDWFWGPLDDKAMDAYRILRTIANAYLDTAEIIARSEDDGK